MAINLLDVIAGHEENENDLLAGIVFGRVVTVNASQSQWRMTYMQNANDFCWR